MSTDTPHPTCIVAYVGGEGQYDKVREAAVDLAKRSHAQLILYDAASASMWSDPLPTAWDGEGEQEKFGDPLNDAELDVLGRASIAGRVKQARAAGVDAWGWLA